MIITNIVLSRLASTPKASLTKDIRRVTRLISMVSRARRMLRAHIIIIARAEKRGGENTSDRFLCVAGT